MKSTGFAEIPQPTISITPHLMTNIKGLEDAQPLSKHVIFQIRFDVFSASMFWSAYRW